MKKNGRLVAIALGSVLCASCVGGAFLVAGSTPAAETVKAANQIDYNYSHTFSISDNSLFNNGASKNLDGIEWTWKGNTPKYFGNTSNCYQLGSGGSGSAFAGGTLSADLSNSEFGTEINGIRVYASSKSGSVKVTIKIGEDVLVEQKTVSWTKIDWITWESDVALTGPISIEFGSSTAAFYLGKIEISSFAAPVVDHIEIAGEPRKEYGLGEDFDISGLTVLAYDSLDDKTPEDVTSDSNFDVTVPDDFTTVAGVKAVTVNATYGEFSASKTFNDIEVKEVVEIYISGDLTKKDYTKGDAIDPDGLIVTAKYNDGSESVLNSGYEFIFDSDTLDYTYITEVDVMASYMDLLSDVYTVSGINVSPEFLYKKATKNSDIYDGAKILIANAEGAVMANYVYDDNNVKVADAETSIVGNELVLPEDTSNIGFVTLEKSGDYYYLVQEVNGQKLYLTSSETKSNTLKGKTEKTDKALFGITISSDGEISTTNKGNSDKQQIRYNPNSDLFATYGSGQDPAYIYVGTSGVADLDDSAVSFRDSIISGIECDPNGTSAPSIDSWNDAANKFNAMLDYHKNLFSKAVAQADGDVFQQVAAKYDYIVGKYGADTYKDFMGRNPSQLSGLLVNKNNLDYSSIIAVAALALAGVAAAGFMIASRRRKAK